MKYKAPKNDKGQEYFVPVVTKSKEYLVGYLTAFEYLLYVLDFDGEVDLNLDSARFNDVIDDGKRISKMTKAEIEDVLRKNVESASQEGIEKKQKEHPDNKKGVLDKSFLEFECHCGMFYSFKTHQEVPGDNFDCGVCGRLLIQYTGKDDSAFEFDGDEARIREIEKEYGEDNGDDEAEESS